MIIRSGILAIILFFQFFTISPALAHNESFMNDFRKRAQEREQKRWTLEEWMAQQDRNRMMDLWLAMNSPSPYEAMVGFNYSSYAKETTNPTSMLGSIESGLIEFHAYSQIFGVSAEYENNNRESYNDLTGMLNIRIFGNSINNSHITLSYGLRTRNQTVSGAEYKIPQQFPMLQIGLHLKRYFGIQGSYRSFTEYNEPTLGKFNGTQTTGGIFIDFSAIRLSGLWFQETYSNLAPLSTTASVTTRTGLRAGLQMFF